MDQTRVLLFFVDGLGIGVRGEHNPLSLGENLEPLAFFRDEPAAAAEDIYGGRLAATDPRLGVEGRPQSASGQTTILTGVNAPAALGYHKQGFPNEAMRGIIAENSVFLQLERLGVAPNVFANTYTPQFFQTPPPRWKSATTCAVEAAAGMRFNRLPDLVGGHALFHDFTNETLRERGFDVPLFSPEEAGETLARIVARHRFTLYEHFVTDKIGHDQDQGRAAVHLPRLALMLRTALSRIDLEKTTVILTSDHGNLEDLSIRTHTLNDVPTVVWGRGREATAARVKTLADITPAIIRLLSS